MKNAAKTPGKLLAGLCLILFFCLMPVRSYAAEQQLSEITKLYVTGIYGSETLPQQKVNWQYADKGYYLCMPSGADLSNVQLHFTENSDGNENADSYVMIGGQKSKLRRFYRSLRNKANCRFHSPEVKVLA